MSTHGTPELNTRESGENRVGRHIPVARWQGKKPVADELPSLNARRGLSTIAPGGMGLFATRDIAQGEYVLRDKPLVSTTDPIDQFFPHQVYSILQPHITTCWRCFRFTGDAVEIADDLLRNCIQACIQGGECIEDREGVELAWHQALSLFARAGTAPAVIPLFPASPDEHGDTAAAAEAAEGDNNASATHIQHDHSRIKLCAECAQQLGMDITRVRSSDPAGAAREWRALCNAIAAPLTSSQEVDFSHIDEYSEEVIALLQARPFVVKVIIESTMLVWRQLQGSREGNGKGSKKVHGNSPDADANTNADAGAVEVVSMLDQALNTTLHGLQSESAIDVCQRKAQKRKHFEDSSGHATAPCAHPSEAASASSPAALRDWLYLPHSAFSLFTDVVYLAYDLLDDLVKGSLSLKLPPRVPWPSMDQIDHIMGTFLINRREVVMVHPTDAWRCRIRDILADARIDPSLYTRLLTQLHSDRGHQNDRGNQTRRQQGIEDLQRQGEVVKTVMGNYVLRALYQAAGSDLDATRVPMDMPPMSGSVVFRHFSLLNHSCTPNCGPTPIARPGEEGFVVALRPIRRGTELTISYIDQCQSVAKRQTDLQVNFGIHCHCARCVAEGGVVGGRGGHQASPLPADATRECKRPRIR